MIDFRAYVVTESDEERSCVVWARNPMEARRLGHGYDDVGCMCEETELHVRRAPEFDELGDRSLRQAQLDEGWWFTCGYCHCNRRVTAVGTSPDSSSEDEYEYEYDAGDGPCVRGDAVYCSDWCAGAEVVRCVQARIDRWALAERAIATLGESIELTNVSEWATAGPAVRFRFPGGKYEASWDPFEDRCFAANYDVEAWQRWRRSEAPGKYARQGGEE